MMMMTTTTEGWACSPINGWMAGLNSFVMGKGCHVLLPSRLLFFNYLGWLVGVGVWVVIRTGLVYRPNLRYP